MKKFLVAISVLFMGACSILGGYSQKSTFYMMNSSGLEKISGKKFNIGVGKVNVPDILNKPQLVVYDKDSHEVNILEFERWGEPLPYVLQGAITSDLMAYLPDSFVKSVEFTSENLDYVVRVKINKIEAYRNDKVVLSAWWHIENTKGKILARRQKTYEVKVKGENISDLVSAENEAVNLLSADIAEYFAKM